MTQQVFGEIQFAASEPPGCRHVARLPQHGFGSLTEAKPAEICECLPELRRLIDRPAVQLRIGIAVLPMHEAIHRGFAQPFSGGLPEDRIFAQDGHQQLTCSDYPSIR